VRGGDQATLVEQRLFQLQTVRRVGWKKPLGLESLLARLEEAQGVKVVEPLVRQRALLAARKGSSAGQVFVVVEPVQRVLERKEGVTLAHCGTLQRGRG
jgi:hypothetical protein